MWATPLPTLRLVLFCLKNCNPASLDAGPRNCLLKRVPSAQEYADKALLRDVAAIDSFVELHIEQGPALEAEGLQVAACNPS